jgi:hypothetical protein
MTVFPVVNINGDSVQTLMQQHWDVLKHSRDLASALSRAAPHGRNYQTLRTNEGEHPTHLARSEWLTLLAANDLIREWAEASLADLMRQNYERNGNDKGGQIAREIIR